MCAFERARTVPDVAVKSFNTANEVICMGSDLASIYETFVEKMVSQASEFMERDSGDLVIPGGKSLELLPQDDTTITVKGNVTFEYFPWPGYLIQINATRLTLMGEEGSFFYGNGEKYWDGMGEWGTPKPRFAKIIAFHSKFMNLTFINSPRHIISIDDSNFVVFDNLVLNCIAGNGVHILSNYSGHNTDGFDIGNSTYVEIRNSQIFNQDDCLSISSGQHIHVSNLFCHGGLGLALSVGSHNDSVPHSVDLNTVKNVTFEDSTVVNVHGQVVHVKTYVDGGNGSISDVTYRNIQFDVPTAKNAISIQQNYRNLPPNHPANASSSEARGNVPITNLKLIDIFGSMSTPTENATSVFIFCAKGACSDWEWENVRIIGARQHNSCKNYTPKGFRC